MTLKFDGAHTQALLAAGLSEEQAHVYEVLLQRGTRQAGQLPKILSLSRPYVYKLLEELIGMGLVVREDPPGKPAQFMPAHPFAVRELVRKKQEEADIAKETVENALSSLVSEFTSVSKMPGVRILPGIVGISTLYADILAEKKDIKLIRSVLDDDAPDRQELVTNQIKKQVALGIRTRILGPGPKEGGLTNEELKKRNQARLTTRRSFPRERFSIPAQVLMYGNKVGITSYEGTLMTTIIDNVAIRATFDCMFELLWESATEP